jgi:uncharacterized protein YdiU (UPF0061 family)
MKPLTLNSFFPFLRNSMWAFLSIISMPLILAFTTVTVYRYEDFLQQLGLTEAQANERINSGILSSSLNFYGIKNIKNMALNDKMALVNNGFAYAREYVNSAAFQEEYKTLRENNAPKKAAFQTPEELHTQLIAQSQEIVQKMEKSYQESSEEMKPVFKEALEDARQALKETEDPENAYMVIYAENYEMMLDQAEQAYQNEMVSWKSQYPANYLLFVKGRLEEFLNETQDIDFNAQLTEVNRVKKFANPAYEQKSKIWKMGFRAGKEPLAAARASAEQWIEEIGN